MLLSKPKVLIGPKSIKISNFMQNIARIYEEGVTATLCHVYRLMTTILPIPKCHFIIVGLSPCGKIAPCDYFFGPIPNVVAISVTYCTSILRFCVRLGDKATLSEGNSFLKRPPPPSDIRLSSFEEEEGEREDGEGDGRRQHRSISLFPSLSLSLSLFLVCFSLAVFCSVV